VSPWADEQWQFYRRRLRERAAALRLNPAMQVRFDESDLVQETVGRALEAERSGAGCRGDTEGERLRWLFAIQDHLLLDAFDREQAGRRDYRREAHDQGRAALRGQLNDSTAVFIGQLPGDGPSPSEAAAGREEQGLLDAALDRLPEPGQTVMRLKLKDHLSYQEIADRLGETKPKVAGIIRRAERELARLLDPEGEPPDE
jgi:RNA polymerase sigma factor (sigma-70 family)